MIRNQLIGALTSKPYAFTARSWELRNVESIDVFDSMGSSIKLSTRGSSILRVLPKINDHINEEWITDKVRFSYDAFKSQRLVYCFKRSAGQFSKIQWNHVFSILKPSFFPHDFVDVSPSRKINFFVGPFVDYETLQIMDHLSMATINSNAIFSHSAVDQRSSYLFNDFNDLNRFKTCLLIGCNLRYEAPMLNLKLRKQVVAKNLFVYNLGFSYKNNFFVKNVGNSLYKLKAFLEGKSTLNLRLLPETTLVIIGNSFAQTRDSIFYFENIKTNYPYTNFLQSEASSVNYYELSPRKSGFKEKSVSWFLDDDKTELLSSSAKDSVVYQGHHNDFNFLNSGLILPSTLFSEKNSTFFNFSGLKQETKFIDSKILNTSVRDDRKILRNINDEDIDSKVLPDELNSGLVVYDLNTKTVPADIFKIKNSFITNYMEDFYRNDSITRNSPVMALVSNRMNNKSSSFQE